MQDDSSRNTIIFLVCALALFIVYQQFVIGPAQKKHDAEAAKQRAVAAQTQAAAAPKLTAPAVVTRDQALGASPRVPIATPSLRGSISLRGARLDDLFLTKYRQTPDKGSPPVDLFQPEGAPYAWFVDFGWAGANVPGLPTANTLWTLSQGDQLAPGRPVVLTYANGQGLTFTRRIEVDADYMFTITDAVANTSGQPVTIAPYGVVQRDGVPPDIGKSSIVHEGAVGWLGDRLRSFTYKDLAKAGAHDQEFTSAGAWAGITDKYWLAALIPNPAEQEHASYQFAKRSGVDLYDVNMLGQARAIGPGQQVSVTQHLFAGAKVVSVLQDYQAKLGVAHLDEAIDWGRFFFWLTRPLLWFLDKIFALVGSFGVAILILTVVVRGVFFPIAQRQYESMTKMKKVQPMMEELRKRFKDDPAKQQQEIMSLYQAASSF